MIVKRLFDIVFSFTILFLLSPLIIFITLLIKMFQGNKIIFKQKRLGLKHHEFSIFKFCTMTNEKDNNGELLPDHQRTTKIGSFLRKTSLDEIPGFINVLIGHMSIVGPRPLPVHYKNRYTPEQDKRHDMKPGVTGLAQINGRNALSWDEKFKYDLKYIKNWSLFLDLKIILSTIIYVLSRKDIVPYNKHSMDEFMGTKTDE